jgi:IclR family pca regulon transcriptional regulator
MASKARVATPRRTRHPDRSSLFVGSVGKAFMVLEAFRDTHRVMSLAEIARAAELDRSATQRLVYTLEQIGYIRRLPDSPLYGLASRVLRLSHNCALANLSSARPILAGYRAHARRDFEPAGTRWHEIVFLARFPGRHVLNLDFAVGSRLPAVYTASGRAILSSLTWSSLAILLTSAAHDSKTETDPKVLLKRIDQRRSRVTRSCRTVVMGISVAARWIVAGSRSARSSFVPSTR